MPVKCGEADIKGSYVHACIDKFILSLALQCLSATEGKSGFKKVLTLNNINKHNRICEIA